MGAPRLFIPLGRSIVSVFGSFWPLVEFPCGRLISTRQGFDVVGLPTNHRAELSNDSIRPRVTSSIGILLLFRVLGSKFECAVYITPVFASVKWAKSEQRTVNSEQLAALKGL